MTVCKTVIIGLSIRHHLSGEHYSNLCTLITVGTSVEIFKASLNCHFPV